MKTLRTIRVFYMIYTAYTIFVMLVSDYKIAHAITGLVCIWAAYFFLEIGYKSKKANLATTENRSSTRGIIFPFSNIQQWSFWTYVLAVVSAWVSAVLAAKFYTGKSFVSVLIALVGGDSVYNLYQKYFLESNIAAFSIAKIPYIIMLAYLSIITIWSMVGLLQANKKLKWWKWLYLIGIVTAYLYFGLARGTNFETYVVFILISFCVLQKTHGLRTGKKIKYGLLFFLLGIVMVLVFRSVVMMRGVEFSNTICPEINFEKDRFISQAFPELTGIGLSLFGYLGYGIYSIGVAVYDIVLVKISSVLAVLLPFGFQMVEGQSLEAALRETIDFGVKWCPDYIKLLDVLGIPLFFASFVLVGRFMKRLQNSSCPELMKSVINCIIYIQMLSFPVGNYLITNSANVLMVMFVFAWYLQYRYLRVGFRTTRNEVP